MNQGMIGTAELEYFTVDECFGGCQDWFIDPAMKMGGCGAVTACDSSIYFARRLGKTALYPGDCFDISKRDYIAFSKKMKPYLRPRLSGIDTLELYMDGFSAYLRDCGESHIDMEGLHGSCCVERAEDAVRRQIDDGMVIPCLTLHHKNPTFHDYVWHWYVLAGYQCTEDTMLVKAVTYGSWCWLDFRQLWDTGFDKKGGLILYHVQ